MKQSKWTLFLVALAIMLVTPSAVKTSVKTKPAINTTIYYWFDAQNNYTGRLCTVDEEMLFTGFDEIEMNPKTIQERGYRPSSVWVGGSGEVVPFGYADKLLYSHP